MDMHLAEWSEKLEFGLPKIDSQHKQLLTWRPRSPAMATRSA